jgi:hypothetical protein
VIPFRLLLSECLALLTPSEQGHATSVQRRKPSLFLVEKSKMQRRTIITGIAATLALVAGRASRSIGGEIQVGDTFEVKANSIWFEDVAKLARWQRLRKHGNAKALTSYQDKALSKRDVWQFVNPLTVKIISYDRGKHRVKVEMTTPGRFLGSTWFLDIDALQE